ncbi:sensor histidine kinase [Vibrio penaeicida]|uniref:sensor histidine kinase n=1 Tax=Vibrio penaeicida TaxID=104609 RepID=UPI000CEA3DEE|nr:ATP-binding protein [Vibrio penaeicida]
MKGKLLLSDLIDQFSFAICIVNRQYKIVKANDYFSTQAVYDSLQLAGSDILKIFPDAAQFLKRKIDTALVIESPSFSSWEQKPHVLPFKSSRPVSGQEDKMFQNIEVIPFHSDNGEIDHVCICVHDATIQASQQHQLVSAKNKIKQEHEEQVHLIKKLEETQTQLIQSEKMASIGQLSAGIAHEINNPVGFVNSNLQTLKTYTDDLLSALGKIETLATSTPNLHTKIQSILNDYQVDFIKDDVSDLLSESLEGASRVMSIVKNLKDFSHVDKAEWTESCIKEGIEATLKIMNNQIKYNIEVQTDYDCDLPKVYCQPMQVNQVILNILMNASQAIDDVGKISIKVQKKNDNVKISISDNGNGIPNQIISKIFDPFFTTKPVGDGTGLGLSVSYGIIKNHKGNIDVESKIGQGTTFIITLPINSG